MKSDDQIFPETGSDQSHTAVSNLQKKLRSFLIPGFSVIVLVFFLSRCIDIPFPAENRDPVSPADIPETFAVGDVINFGSYEQDNDLTNGSESVEWLVLAVESRRALLISRYALDAKPFNSKWSRVTWEKSSLRKWLNNEFLNAAFSAEEQKLIPTVTVSADHNPSYSTSPGKATQDKVFLLSISEVNKYFKSDEARKCAPTDYAVAQGAYTNDSYKVEGRATCWWWLRSPGINSYYAAYVYGGGSVLNYGSNVSLDDYAVRPALWISLEP